MKTTKLDERFFDSTRGRIVSLLREGSGTVNELAERLELTDNAVRAHLLSLERDGLIRQSGVQRGSRKPHFSYELTPDAEHLFPKAYDALLNQLITALKGRLPPDALEDVLREVGRSLAASQVSAERSVDLEGRVQRALEVLKAMGGSPRVERADGKLFIRSGGCPLSAAVIEHPEVCELAEALVTEIIGVPVREHCDRGESPKCCFELDGSE
ncbi:MAG TPA: ArsR family transcriptional regulator [Pyrinomonadaceae bacterium]|jgi:predicted ArsR family transcriptional regulator|nr:ArsR family transcriptional regulator [Pyrinomonadaceae bacterium]